MAEDIVGMSRKELKRLHVILKVLDRKLSAVEAAKVFSLSLRQIKRLVKKVRVEGNRGLAHKPRGKPSGRRFPSCRGGGPS